MDYRVFFEEIHKLRLHSRFNINCGGCGHVALILHEHFPNLKLMYFDRERGKAPNRAWAPDHVVLYDGENYYDGEGNILRTKSMSRGYSPSRYNIYPVTREYLKISVDEAWLWNEEFHIDKLPQIKREVKDLIKELKKKNKHEAATV